MAKYESECWACCSFLCTSHQKWTDQPTKTTPTDNLSVISTSTCQQRVKTGLLVTHRCARDIKLEPHIYQSSTQFLAGVMWLDVCKKLVKLASVFFSSFWWQGFSCSVTGLITLVMRQGLMLSGPPSRLHVGAAVQTPPRPLITASQRGSLLL